MDKDAFLARLAERFCQAPLPDSVCADLCATEPGPMRTGTNILTVTEATEVLAFVLADETCSSWTSPSLGRAYSIVERVRDSLGQPPESGIDEGLRRALEAIEAADCELVGIAV